LVEAVLMQRRRQAVLHTARLALLIPEMVVAVMLLVVQA
jgi:hypothetical protein